ncbi:hypothetical protein CF204P1_23310 [Citrobacter freundii]|nr:hypothetical protein CF204P1_23310 [Citrobacter freundii]
MDDNNSDITSMRGCVISPTFSAATMASSNAAIYIEAHIKNIARQFSTVIINPDIVGPNAGARVIETPTTPITFPQ